MSRLRTLLVSWRWSILAFFIAFAAGCAIIAVNARAEYDRLVENERATSSAFAADFQQHFSKLIQPGVSATAAIEVLAQTTRTRFTSATDQTALDEIKMAAPSWRNLSVSPNNCISAVAPREGNEKAIGYCLTSDPKEGKIIEALIASKTPQLVGPIKLAQGQNGFIFDRPVFLFDGTYWGIASAVIDQDVLTGELQSFAKKYGQDITVSTVGKTEQSSSTIISQSFNPGMPRTTTTFSYGDDTYRLTSAPSVIDQSTVQQVQNRGGAAALLIGVLAALIVGIWGRQVRTQRRLERITSTAPSVIFQIEVAKDKNFQIAYISENCEPLLGLSSSELLNDPAGLVRGMDARDRNAARDRLNSAQSPGEIWSQRLGYTRTCGTRMWLQADATYSPRGRGQGVWNGVLVDATETARHEESLATTSTVFATMSEGVAILDAEFTVLQVNQSLTDLTGYSQKDLRGRKFTEFSRGTESPAMQAAIIQGLTEFGEWRGQVTNVHAGGRVSRDFLSFSATKDASGAILRIVVVMTPNERLFIDAVTQLPNRPLFESQLSHGLETMLGTTSKLTLAHIGIEGIGAVNDSFGHAAGDRVLRELAVRLQQFSESSENIGRIADMEFALFRLGDDVDEGIEEWVQEILSAISEPFSHEDIQILVKATAGVAISPEDGLTVAELRSHADQAFKSSLEPNADAIQFFSQQMENRARIRSYLTSDLREALRREEIEFYLQPIVRLSDEQVVKAETLARWIDPQLGEISPSRFIPLAEASNLIHELGSQLFASCVAVAKRLQALGMPIQISINLSPAELMSTAFARQKQLLEAIDQGLDPRSITFELTEGMLLERPDVVLERIQSLRAVGVQFAIDDFGTGYSSLAYLQKLEVDYVKIDKSFVDQIDSTEGVSLCKSIIDLAHALHLEVIAEGVETREQADRLLALECDFAQGYLYSRPISQDDFVDFLGSRQQLTR